VSEHEFTPDQIVSGIHQAMKDRELNVIPSLIKLLATQVPYRAQDILDAFEIAQLVASPRDGS
jgi:hypothetical protein